MSKRTVNAESYDINDLGHVYLDIRCKHPQPMELQKIDEKNVLATVFAIVLSKKLNMLGERDSMIHEGVNVSDRTDTEPTDLELDYEKIWSGHHLFTNHAYAYAFIKDFADLCGSAVFEIVPVLVRPEHVVAAGAFSLPKKTHEGGVPPSFGYYDGIIATQFILTNVHLQKTIERYSPRRKKMRIS